MTPGTPLRCWGDPATTAASPPAGLLPAGPLALGARIGCAQPVEPTGPVCWGPAVVNTGPAAPVDVLRAGDAHACAIAGGALSCWGSDARGQASPPVEPGWIDVATGGAHTCGVTLDGRARCWGDNTFGQAAAPAGAFLAVAAGQYTTCAIDAPTSGLACWGDDAGAGLLSPPPGLYAAVAVGDAHACAIDADGAISCWGDNAAGQLAAPAGLFTALTAGDDHTCAIRREGGGTCWGALAH